MIEILPVALFTHAAASKKGKNRRKKTLAERVNQIYKALEMYISEKQDFRISENGLLALFLLQDFRIPENVKLAKFLLEKATPDTMEKVLSGSEVYLRYTGGRRYFYRSRDEKGEYSSTTFSVVECSVESIERYLPDWKVYEMEEKWYSANREKVLECSCENFSPDKPCKHVVAMSLLKLRISLSRYLPCYIEKSLDHIGYCK